MTNQPAHASGTSRLWTEIRYGVSAMVVLTAIVLLVTWFNVGTEPTGSAEPSIDPSLAGTNGDNSSGPCR